MIDLLADNPVLLFFVVAALGYLLARVRVAGFGLGIASVLFAGIAVGAVDPSLKLPEPVWVLGLVLFVYTVGLASGPGFVAALRRQGLRANAVVLAALGAASFVALAAGLLDVLSTPTAAGTYTGSVTNTPALASVLEALGSRVSPETFDRIAAEPIIGYSLAYPLGVVIPLVAVWALLRGAAPAETAPAGGLVSRTAAVGRSAALADLRVRFGVAFGRVRRQGTTIPASDDEVVRPGDLVSVAGPPPAVGAVIATLGEESSEHLELEHGTVDFRRVVVSSPDVAGRRVGELPLHARFNAQATRVRRGDIDLVADPELQLELGDRVRVVAPRERMPELARYFGDSIRALGEIDVLTFSLGAALGLLLGSIDVPLPGGGTFELGFAGGPLVVALALGALGRTGPFVWQLPYTANLTLRQFGAVLFLAGVGTRSGEAFGSTIADVQALLVLATAAATTATAVGLAVLGGLRLLRLSPATLCGVLAGMQTQPAVLAYASEQVADEREVTAGYASVYPFAMIAKILGAQLLFGPFF
ncbi:MAG TPA: TrkA C-terminal domain-containing protein [Gaiellaceae bacterium]|nr:TrkA C-terminal domain-containing protein [Gaiellaceae bacterium]